MNGCFTCLNCGKINPIKGHSYTNKYCNNSCQQQHRGRMLFSKWKEHPETVVGKLPDWLRKNLIESRGGSCEVCGGSTHNNKSIPLDIIHRDRNTYNNSESNLQLICPNCKAQH